MNPSTYSLLDALCHDVIQSYGAGGVEVQRDVQPLRPEQGAAEPQGQAGPQRLPAGLVTELGHPHSSCLHSSQNR